MLRASSVGVGGDGIAPQQVLGLDRAQIADRHAAGRKVLDRRQGAHADHQRLELSQRGLALPPLAFGIASSTSRTSWRWTIAAKRSGRYTLRPATYWPPQRGAHVDKADRLVGARAAQLLEQLHAGRARAVDQHVRVTFSRARTGISMPNSLSIKPAVWRVPQTKAEPRIG